MKRSIIFCAGLLATVWALAGERVAIWPEGKIPDLQSHQIAATTQEARAPGFKAAEHTMPYLDWYEAPAEKNGGCMLLISGGGYQAFWKLDEPLYDFEKAEAINRGLALAVGADDCFNIDRIMRLPGTINWPNAKKREAGRTEALAYVVE